MGYLLGTIQRQDDYQSPRNMPWDTHHFRFSLMRKLARCNRKGDTCTVWKVTFATRGRMVARYFPRQHLLSLILPGKPGMVLVGQPTWWLFQHCKGDGCSNCELVFLILLGSTTVYVAYTQTFIPLLFLLRCLFLQSFLTYHLSKTDCSKN